MNYRIEQKIRFDNIRAKQLYERIGFKVESITDTHYEMKYFSSGK